MKLPAAILVLLSLSLSACGERPETAAQASDVTATPAASTSTTPATDPPEEREPVGRIRLGRLPATGLAVSSRWGTRFVDLSGKLLHGVPDLQMAGNPGAPDTWFQLGKTYLRLDVAKGVLIPVARKTAQARMYGEGPEPHLPIPAGVDRAPNGDVSGHWRFAITSVSGDALGQWSDECEVPFAFWIEPGGEPEIITGETDLAEAPTSKVVGWTVDGRALVLLPEGLCSEGADPPGVYAFTSPGVGELVYKTHHSYDVEMWGP